MVTLFTIKNWQSRPVIALLAAAVLIFPSIFPGGGTLILLPQAEAATTYNITTNTTWTNKGLQSGDVVNVAAGATLTITGQVGGSATTFNVNGIVNIVKTGNDPNVKGGKLLISILDVNSGGLVAVYNAGYLRSDGGDIDGKLELRSGSKAEFPACSPGATNVYGTVNNNGLVVVNQHGCIRVFGTFNNNGAIEVTDSSISVNPGGSLNTNIGSTLTIINSGGLSTLYISGLVDVNPGSTIDVKSGAYLEMLCAQGNSCTGALLNIDGKVNIDGTFEIQVGETRVNNGGILNNRADGFTSIYGKLNINNGGKLDNEGFAGIVKGGALWTRGAITNDGTINQQCGSTFTLAPAGGSFTGNPIDHDTCIVINDVSLNEGNSGNTNFAFKVSRPFGTTGTTTVKFATAAGTATAGTDYTTKSGTLTFTAGQTSKTVIIVVKGDTAVEPNEKFNVKLSSCSSYTVCTITDGTGVGTIKNDDGT